MYIGGIGVILALALLIAMAFKRWNLIIVSILAALVVGITNKLGFWETLSDYFMPGAVSFFKSWFLVFTIGAMYSEFMTRSGSVTSIAYKLVDVFGKKYVILIMLIICVLLNLGGINPYVQIFILWPIMVVFSKESDIPRSIWLAVFYLGMLSSFSFPGNPGMVNTVAATLLNTSPSSSFLLSLVIFLVYVGIGYAYLVLTTKRWKAKGLHYVETERDKNTTAVSRENCPGFAKSIVPMVLVLVLYTGLSAGWFEALGIPKISATNAILASMAIASLTCFFLNFGRLKNEFKKIVCTGAIGGVNPTIMAGVISGFVAVVTSSAAYAGFVAAVQNLGGHPYFQVLISGNVIAFLTGSAVVAANTTMSSFGQAWLGAGISPEILRPLLVVNVSGMSIPPHCGGLSGVMDFTGTDMKESYLPCVLGVMIPSLITSILITVVMILL